jgi:hypothetical protein
MAMPSPDNRFQVLAQEAADRLDRARAAGEQLELLPVAPDTDAAMVPQGAGVPGRGRGKAQVSQVRSWLAAKGYRMPEDVLSEMAGLASGEDAFTTAMVRAEQAMLWAGASLPPKARIDLFLQLYAMQLRAADALMPYGAAKVSTDAPRPASVQVNVIGGTVQDAGAQARDVTPREGRAGQRIAPPPMPWEMQQNQAVADEGDDATDGQSRTEGPSA